VHCYPDFCVNCAICTFALSDATTSANAVNVYAQLTNMNALRNANAISKREGVWGKGRSKRPYSRKTVLTNPQKAQQAAPLQQKNRVDKSAEGGAGERRAGEEPRRLSRSRRTPHH
jgi:hypothetical protein